MQGCTSSPDELICTALLMLEIRNVLTMNGAPLLKISQICPCIITVQKHMRGTVCFIFLNACICDFLGLQVLYTLLKNIENESASQSFYQTYYIMIVQHVLSVVTDTSHTASLSMHATILAHMFSLADTGKISEPLFNASEVQYPSNEV